ncbi:MAG TPA: ParA family protein [Thermodesulfobacteriota bacterium]|nr:ParA family protein [Thermodesulfobacteriota bacterium]
MAKVIALINQKGGVGKTTSTLNIGAGLSRLGYKVLLIDLDPQAHLTYSLGIQAHELKNTVDNLLKQQAALEEVLIERPGLPGLSLIPSTLDLAGADIELSGIPGREYLLKEALVRIRGFDYVLIDCPPSLGLLTLNALVAAQEVYIPLQTEFLALRGLSKLLETVEVVKSRLNKDLEITGIIATRFDSRKILNRDIVDKIKEYFGDKLFNTLIRENISLAEAPSYGQTIFEYKPDSYGAEDYLSLCEEIIKRE